MKTLVFLFLMVLPFATVAQNCTVNAYSADEKIGERETVCGIVSNVHFAENTRGNPVYINFGDKFPNHVFTIVIWGDDVKKFEYDLKSLANRQLAVSGLIKEYNGKPQITVKNPSQIRIIK